MLTCLSEYQIQRLLWGSFEEHGKGNIGKKLEEGLKVGISGEPRQQSSQESFLRIHVCVVVHMQED